jgi:hypothetical protein
MQCTTAEPPQSPLADECDVLAAEFDHALHHEKLLQAVEDDHADFADLAVASRQLVRLESYNGIIQHCQPDTRSSCRG